ncbi:hypothetical protein [Bacteroides pyogenes]|nr:hypothetical protein [Bacteroides pyogenes]
MIQLGILLDISENGEMDAENIINLASFVVRNDTIKLLDSFKNTLLAYSTTGNFLYEKKAPDGVLANVKDVVSEKDEILFMSNYIYNEQNNIYTRWNTSTDEVSVIANAKIQTDGTKESVGTRSFCSYGNNIRYVMPFSNIILSTQNNAIEFLTSKKVLKDSELQNIHNFSIMIYLIFFSGFCNIFETDNYIILTFFNLEYTVIDKRNNKCFRYNYQINEEDDGFPLFNILSSNENVLIGIADLEDYDILKDKMKDYIVMKEKENTDYDNIIIKYHEKLSNTCK